MAGPLSLRDPIGRDGEREGGGYQVTRPRPAATPDPVATRPGPDPHAALSPPTPPLYRVPRQGKTAAEWAAEQGHAAIAERLRAAA